MRFYEKSYLFVDLRQKLTEMVAAKGLTLKLYEKPDVLDVDVTSADGVTIASITLRLDSSRAMEDEVMYWITSKASFCVDYSDAITPWREFRPITRTFRLSGEGHSSERFLWMVAWASLSFILSQDVLWTSRSMIDVAKLRALRKLSDEELSISDLALPYYGAEFRLIHYLNDLQAMVAEDAIPTAWER